MENKYYTPKAEEFHVGFEYEVFEKGRPAEEGVLYSIPHEEKDKYYKFKFPDPFYGYHLDKLLNQREVRVKYLDREDIESLGFKFGTRLTERTVMYYLKGCAQTKLSYNEKEHTIRLAVHNGAVEVLKNIIIKNKSELRKILIQAEILEDGK